MIIYRLNLKYKDNKQNWTFDTMLIVYFYWAIHGESVLTATFIAVFFDLLDLWLLYFYGGLYFNSNINYLLMLLNVYNKFF